MSDTLPPLPKSAYTLLLPDCPYDPIGCFGYPAEEVRSYAAECVALERERCAKLADEYATCSGGNFHDWFKKLAEAIRADGRQA